MFYCHNISGCHVGLLHGRNAHVISAPRRRWLSHVSHEPNGLMHWSKVSLSTWVLGVISHAYSGVRPTPSLPLVPVYCSYKKLKAGTSLVVQWLKLQLPKQGA